MHSTAIALTRGTIVSNPVDPVKTSEFEGLSGVSPSVISLHFIPPNVNSLNGSGRPIKSLSSQLPHSANWHLAEWYSVDWRSAKWHSAKWHSVNRQDTVWVGITWVIVQGCSWASLIFLLGENVLANTVQHALINVGSLELNILIFICVWNYNQLR